jgi:hypothetical protein
MDWQSILATVWAAMNSPAGITAMAGVVLWLLNRLYTAKPLWAEYEGTLIAAVKQAEKLVPDDSPNKSLARLDAALKYALQVYESAKGRKATQAEVAELTNGIQMVHSDLEAGGQL